MKKVIAIIMIVLVASTSVFCVTASAAQTGSSKVNTLGFGGPANFREDRPDSLQYHMMRNYLQEIGDTGYAIVKIEGSDDEFFVMRYENRNIGKTIYDLYDITDHGLFFAGFLDGSYGTAYTDTKTGYMGLYNLSGYGLVHQDGNLNFSCEWKNRGTFNTHDLVFSGTNVHFYAVDDYTGIDRF